MMPSAEELIYFHEIANSLSISRAAQKLKISQPSLSMAMKRMERTVGTELFVRHKQGVTLTPAGKKFLIRVKKLLELWEETRLETFAAHHEIQGEITLGCHSTIALYISKLLSHLFETYPHLSIHLELSSSQRITENVINSSIDIGIVLNPILHPNLIIRKLNDSEMTFWKGNSNQKIQQPDHSELIIICDPQIPQSTFLLKKWKDIYKQSCRIIKVNNLEVVANLTVNNCGIGILPSCFIKTIYPNQLNRIPSAPSCNDEIYLIYRIESKKIKAIETVISKIKAVMLEEQFVV